MATCIGGTQHASHVEVWHQWRLYIRDGTALAVETSMLHEVDGMASVVMQEPLLSPSQMAIFAKKVQTIIRRCMVSIGSTSGCTPSHHDIQQIFLVQPLRRRPQEPIPDRGDRGVKRGAHRLLGGGAHGGRPSAPPDPSKGHVDPGRGGEICEGSRRRGLGDLGSSYQIEPFNSPNLDMLSFSLSLTQPTKSHLPTSYAPPPPGLGSSFQAPPPLHMVGSSIPHMPMSTASSSDSDEHDDEPTDVVTPAQQLGFGHHVGRRLPDSHHLTGSSVF
ncbi:hypothetical protein M9H77_02398 [Catharanthus roseus]|uniref:Uncharacterized protein n=1 Tax=Catharanthus roseus TaxID=4058 RepID=A0ACC0C8C0_CATRO|nr:hypothetical protein M9H77_02398 [Catharanthus roseus]